MLGIQIHAIQADKASLCFLHQFDNFLKDFAVAYRQAFIERGLYQFFMIIRVKVIGIV